MEDIPPNMPIDAYGVYEPDGMCIWMNEDLQGNIVSRNTGVLSHEFTHYMHSISTFHAISDLLDLIFFVHASIQRLEEQEQEVRLPLKTWAKEPSSPDFVKDFVNGVRNRRDRILRSLGRHADNGPPNAVPAGLLYKKNNTYFIRVTNTLGIPVQRLALMEGAATAKKCEALGNPNDLIQKRNAGLWHYVAAYEACRSANKHIDPLSTAKYLCDVALCADDPGRIFAMGIMRLSKLGGKGSLDQFEDDVSNLYNSACRQSIDIQKENLERALATLPDYEFNGQESWATVSLNNAFMAVAKRQNSPLSLIKPAYLGKELLNLATEIGSPVILTNDMRLTMLCRVNSPFSLYGTLAVRTLSYLCKWVVEAETTPLVCPYAGCPECPPTRRGEHCKNDARKVISLPDELPWCALYYSAQQLRLGEIIGEDLKRRDFGS